MGPRVSSNETAQRKEDIINITNNVLRLLVDRFSASLLTQNWFGIQNHNSAFRSFFSPKGQGRPLRTLPGSAVPITAENTHGTNTPFHL